MEPTPPKLPSPEKKTSWLQVVLIVVAAFVGLIVLIGGACYYLLWIGATPFAGRVSG
ncbi:MAG: hypothetical protein ACRDWS_03455 [Acidimicrobiia bacterium]